MISLNGFLRLRAIGFSIITFVSLVWATLLSFDLFFQWNKTAESERSLVAVIIFMNTATTVMLPILLILDFRIWLDTARVLFLLMAHIGPASTFAAWHSSFQCSNQSTDEEDVCRILNIYILIGNWVNPALLLVYSVCLAAVVYFAPKLSLAATLVAIGDDEGTTGSESNRPSGIHGRHLSRPSRFIVSLPPAGEYPLSNEKHASQTSDSSRQSQRQLPWD